MAVANMKDIKSRIKSVESTMQITKAMELVASSKMKKAKVRAESAQPYFNSLYETMSDISSDSAFSSIYTNKRQMKNVLLVVIAGDRGLAGGFNSNILKSALARAEEIKKTGSVKILALGKKSVEFFEKRSFDMIGAYQQVAENFTIYTAMDIADEIVSSYKDGEFDKVELFFTTLVSALVQEPQRISVLPIENIKEKKATRCQTIYEPSASAVFESLIPKYITGIVYGAVVDSFAAEQAARRVAMESANDNASDMIDSLSLMYNRARQAAITQEITEIIGGSQKNN